MRFRGVAIVMISVNLLFRMGMVSTQRLNHAAYKDNLNTFRRTALPNQVFCGSSVSQKLPGAHVATEQQIRAQ